MGVGIIYNNDGLNPLNRHHPPIKHSFSCVWYAIVTIDNTTLRLMRPPHGYSPINNTYHVKLS